MLHTYIIEASLKTEAGRSQVQGQPGQKQQDPVLKTKGLGAQFK
jgi:hypothetical protein